MAQIVGSAFDNVQRSVVRIKFQNIGSKKDAEWIVIAGLIVSIENDQAQILADYTLFDGKKKRPFWVAFPTDDGAYENEREGSHNWVRRDGLFSKFSLVPLAGFQYVQALSFETRVLTATDEIYAFVFPRESYTTPVASCMGYIANATHTGSNVPVYFNAPFHEYGFLGSPIMNRYSHIVGISYLDQSLLAVHTVRKLQAVVLNANSRYLRDGEVM